MAKDHAGLVTTRYAEMTLTFGVTQNTHLASMTFDEIGSPRNIGSGL